VYFVQSVKTQQMSDVYLWSLQEFLDAGVEYQKIYTEGHSVPNHEVQKT